MNQNHKLFAEKLRAVIAHEEIKQEPAFKKLQRKAADLYKSTGEPRFKECLPNKFGTFKKVLRGQYLKGRLKTLAEVACVAFSTEGVGVEDYIDPKVSLATFKELIGADAEPASGSKEGDSVLRLVHKVLFLIKARGTDQVSRLLCYFSSDWERTLLLPNAKPPQGGSPDAELCSLLAERLNIAVSGITLTYRPKDKSMTTDTIKPTGDQNKARNSGRLGRYLMHYCPVQIAEPAAHLLQPSFEVGGTSFRWVTLGELKADRQASQKNHDVLEFLSGKYDATLFHLALSFPERINTES